MDFFSVPRLAFKSLLDEDGEVMAKRSVTVEPKDQVNWSIKKPPFLNVEQDVVPIIVNTTTEVIQSPRVVIPKQPINFLNYLQKDSKSFT